MTKPDAREEARAADDATISSAPRWVPVWATPNVTFDDPVETSHAALVPLHDERLRAIAEWRATIDAFLRSFRDEFGVQISPTVRCYAKARTPSSAQAVLPERLA